MEKTKIQTIGISRTDKKTGRTITKQYATVDSRVEFFRVEYPGWSIETDFPVLDLSKNVCICVARIRDQNGKLVSQGTAHEWQSKPGSMVNSTSFIENAETSAVGRALGFLGIGINGLGIATAEEISAANAHADANDPAPLIDDTIPTFDSADDWLTVNAFQGIADRCNDIAELQKIINGQRTNPQISELIAIASARKAEIVAAQQ